ncbi:hypothetical protein [Arthrobacter sp. HLT1-20]
MARREVWKRALGILGLLLGMGLALWLLVTNPWALSGVLALVLWSAVGIGIIIRLIRTPRGTKMRGALGPVADAAETYQQLLIGREPVSESMEKAFPPGPDGRANSGS